MELAMPVVWSERCLLHQPLAEIWIGLRTPAAETPDRIERIRTALDGATFVEAQSHDDTILCAVHDAAFLRYLESAWHEWESAGLEQDRVVPYVFPHPALGSAFVEPAAVWAKPGFFAYDTMTLIGPGTWEAARAAIDVALTAADLVNAGARAAYACTRPPGHHACRAAYGGSCYLNNAACAAAVLDGRVAIVDIDAHHGNGTQEIFAGSDVLVGSVHVDPRAGWFPHFLGFADAPGAKNVTLQPGTGDDEWLAAVGELVSWAREADGVVVSLGVDAAADDPESPLEVTRDGFREAGALVGALGLPTVLVQEGGYHGAIGELVHETLLGFEAA